MHLSACLLSLLQSVTVSGLFLVFHDFNTLEEVRCYVLSVSLSLSGIFS